MAEQLTFKRYDGLNRTPALSLAAHGWIEALDAGLVDHVVGLHWSDNAFVAFDGDQPIGVITYRPMDYLKEWQVGVGYVLPARRRQGVYAALWDTLVKYARENKVGWISGGTSLRNDVMRRHAARAGRLEDSVNFTFAVPQESPDGG